MAGRTRAGRRRSEKDDVYGAADDNSLRRCGPRPRERARPCRGSTLERESTKIPKARGNHPAKSSPGRSRKPEGNGADVKSSGSAAISFVIRGWIHRKCCSETSTEKTGTAKVRLRISSRRCNRCYRNCDAGQALDPTESGICCVSVRECGNDTRDPGFLRSSTR